MCIRDSVQARTDSWVADWEHDRQPSVTLWNITAIIVSCCFQRISEVEKWQGRASSETVKNIPNWKVRTSWIVVEVSACPVPCYGRKRDEFGASSRNDVESASYGADEVCWGRTGWPKTRYRRHFTTDHEHYGSVSRRSASEVRWNRIRFKLRVHLERPTFCSDMNMFRLQLCMLSTVENFTFLSSFDNGLFYYRSCILFARKHALNCHRMKPALFTVLCEIKEKTGNWIHFLHVFCLRPKAAFRLTSLWFGLSVSRSILGLSNERVIVCPSNALFSFIFSRFHFLSDIFIDLIHFVVIIFTRDRLIPLPSLEILWLLSHHQQLKQFMCRILTTLVVTCLIFDKKSSMNLMFCFG